MTELVRTLQIKRSQTPNAEPASLLLAELAANVGDTPPMLFIGDGANAVMAGPVYYTTDNAPPANPKDGTVWLDEQLNSARVRIAGVWIPLEAAGNTMRVENTWTNVAGQSVFNWAHNVNHLDVYLNGVKLVAITDYAFDGVDITLAQPIKHADDVLHANSDLGEEGP